MSHILHARTTTLSTHPADVGPADTGLADVRPVEVEPEDELLKVVCCNDWPAFTAAAIDNVGLFT